MLSSLMDFVERELFTNEQLLGPPGGSRNISFLSAKYILGQFVAICQSIYAEVLISEYVSEEGEALFVNR